MNSNTYSKLIVIPEVGVDLFSLINPYGISRGPVNTPIRLDMQTIKNLLMQYNQPKIYEVMIDETSSAWKDGRKITAYTEKVLLTMDNYTKNYEEILGKPMKEEVKVNVKIAAVEEIAPPVVDESDVLIDSAEVVEAPTVVETETIAEEVIETEESPEQDDQKEKNNKDRKNRRR